MSTETLNALLALSKIVKEIAAIHPIQSYGIEEKLDGFNEDLTNGAFQEHEPDTQPPEVPDAPAPQQAIGMPAAENLRAGE